MNAKYIICEVKGKGVIPIIFFNDLHKNIYNGLCKVHMSVKVTSAGFVKFKDGTIEAYGESVSLGIGSIPTRDSLLLTKLIMKK